MPQVKKHSDVRRRGNRASTAATLSAVPDDAGPPPKLPDDVEWHAKVTEWWTDLWASPMSGEYHDSDVHQLYVLAGLYQAFWTTPAARVRDRILIAAEVRLQRMAFGLTPYDRRRLEWTIEQAAEAQDRGRRRRAQVVPAPVSGADPRAAMLRPSAG